MTDRPTQPEAMPPTEIEVTPEMIAAGRDEVFDLDMASVVRIYTAMEKERRKSYCQEP